MDRATEWNVPLNAEAAMNCACLATLLIGVAALASSAWGAAPEIGTTARDHNPLPTVGGQGGKEST